MAVHWLRWLIANGAPFLIHVAVRSVVDLASELLAPVLNDALQREERDG